MSTAAEPLPRPDPTNTVHYQLAHREVVTGLLKYRMTRRRRFRWMAPAALAFLVLVVGQEWFPIYRYSRFALAMGLLIMAVRAPLRLSVIINRIVKRETHLTAPRTVSFNEQAITSEAPDRKSEFKWTAFKQVTQDIDYFYLHADHLGNVVIVPKRAFNALALAYFQRCSRCLPPT